MRLGLILLVPCSVSGYQGGPQADGVSGMELGSALCKANAVFLCYLSSPFHSFLFLGTKIEAVNKTNEKILSLRALMVLWGEELRSSYSVL